MIEAEYRQLYELKRELHELMRELIIRTRLGCIEESGIEGDGPEKLNLEFAGGGLYSSIYYEQVRFCDSDYEEYELDDELEIIRKIVEELEKKSEEIDNLADKEQFVEILNKKFTGKMGDEIICWSGR